MLTAKEAKRETDQVTKAEIFRREKQRVRRVVESVMADAVAALEAAIRDKKYQARVDGPEADVMTIVEDKLRRLGYQTIGSYDSTFYVKFSWDKK